MTTLPSGILMYNNVGKTPLCGFINNNNRLAFKNCDMNDLTNNEYFKISMIDNQFEFCKQKKCFEIQTLSGNVLSLDNMDKNANIISKNKDKNISELDEIKKTFVVGNNMIFPGTIHYGMPYAVGINDPLNTNISEFSISLKNISKNFDPLPLKMSFVMPFK